MGPRVPLSFSSDDKGILPDRMIAALAKAGAILPAYELLHVDFGEIAHAPQGFAAGAWRELFGADPSIANYLFYAQPTTMITTTFLPGALAS